MAALHRVRRIAATPREVVEHVAACLADGRDGVRLEEPSGHTFSLVLHTPGMPTAASDAHAPAVAGAKPPPTSPRSPAPSTAC